MIADEIQRAAAVMMSSKWVYVKQIEIGERLRVCMI